MNYRHHSPGRQQGKICGGVPFGIIIGILIWGGFNWGLAASNSEEFCVSCHEHQQSFNELQETVHYINRTGVRATCADCHIPRGWKHMVPVKISATIHELSAKMKGTITTPEEFEANRLRMAMLEWKRMKENGSRECKNCHKPLNMDLSKQEPRSADRHERASEKGLVCIDCHKGISHHLPAGWKEAVKKKAYNE